MTETSKPIVRLETSSAAKKAQKKAVAEAKEQTIKLAIRLNEGINEALRTLIRYRGDLSTMAPGGSRCRGPHTGRPSQRGRADGP